MNRLVIVGNGFDLAHGLPTGYCDFINDYWRKVSSSSYKDEFVKFNLENRLDFTDVQSFDSISNQLAIAVKGTLHSSSKGCYIERLERFSGALTRYEEYILEFTNGFFGLIAYKQHIKNWVDIENEYYRLLKECLKEDNNEKVKKLNYEFEQVKNLLEEYLDEKVSKCFNFEAPNDKFQELLQIFMLKPLRLSENPDHNYYKEFQREDYKDLIQFDDAIIKSYSVATVQSDIDDGKIIQNNLILNFNYTPVSAKYVDMMNRRSVYSRRIAFGNTWQIQIHGQLKNPDNAINFGFGDEMDDDYKLIENKDDNEYLRNIKSFQYLQNSNYKEMLDFIESGKFQVYIMGHSCGLSDRILLNKIFEHKFCCSIKVFYHQKGDWDNYTEIVQNISRHFNKKEMMREKIVNKSLCQPLPQGVRFEEKNKSSQL